MRCTALRSESYGGNGHRGGHGIADVMRDIKEGWAFIEDELRVRVKKVFSVREVDGHVFVNM